MEEERRRRGAADTGPPDYCARRQRLALKKLLRGFFYGKE